MTITQDPIDRTRFPVDEWALVETEFDDETQGRTETLFALGNGYLGLRGNYEDAREGYSHGTFINGFHETWPIRHAEEAFGFARVGQTIVNVPDAKILRLYVDDEPFEISTADVLDYGRRLDFRDGTVSREVVWRTPSGKRVKVVSKRVVSFHDRHLAVIEYEVTLLDQDASLVMSSQILNRQDGVDEYQVVGGKAVFDPRKAEAFADRVLQPTLKRAEGGRYMLGYRATNSGMTIMAASQHRIETENEWDESSQLGDDLAKHVYRVRAKAGQPVRVTKLLTYHSSRGVPTRELADRCDRTLDRALEYSLDDIYRFQREWLDDYWRRSDVEIAGQPQIQQATRWALLQLAHSTARTDGGGIAAKGVSGSGYGGHYFWDTEIYVLPFLTYTSPIVARNALRFRQGMLEPARQRAAELNQRGALFPWRTINGLESSAYYAAGTAQYHIDADIAYALQQYLNATGDEEFMARGAIDILVETARMWADLGFWRENGDQRFHIHGVTGPDEYTTVVNDNLYTNVMARANLRAAALACVQLQADDPESYTRMVARLELDESEVAEWTDAAEAMYIPFDADLGIHPQDDQFLEKELWDVDNTPPEKRPLLLHFHPLVIYRFQVLKQADVVLALLLQSDDFTPEEKRRDFEYYDALTTGDSSLSAPTQAIIAAEVGYHELAKSYFMHGLFVDLADLHNNAADGLHVASTGGAWSALVFGFGGMRDAGGRISFDPRLPQDWPSLTFRVTVRGTLLRVHLTAEAITFRVEEGEGTDVSVRGERVRVEPGAEATVALEHQGPRLEGAPSTADIAGSRRADGSVITASMPTIHLDRPDTGSITVPS